MVIILLLTAIMMIVWIYRSMITPIQKLRVAAENIKEGNLDFALDTQGDDEIGRHYGYLFWMMPDGAFRADGKYGQYCIVLPKKNAVVAINSMQIEDEKKVLRAAVQTVLPLL